MRYLCSTKNHGYRDSTNPLRDQQTALFASPALYCG